MSFVWRFSGLSHSGRPEDREAFFASPELGLTLIRPVRKDEKTPRPFLNWLGQRVEGDRLDPENQLGLERHGGPVPAGL